MKTIDKIGFGFALGFVVYTTACHQEPKQIQQEEAATTANIAQSGKVECSISGAISDAKDKMLTLQGFLNGNPVGFDSVMLSVAGDFKFIIKPKSLDYYRLKVGNQGFINTLVDTNCSINVNADAKQLNSYTVKGCEQSELFATLDHTLKASYAQTDSINSNYHKAEARNAPHLELLITQMEKSYDSTVRIRIEFARTFAKAHYNSPVAISATQFLDPMRESDLFVKIDTTLIKLYGNNRYVKDFHARYGDLAKKVPIGGLAPDIVAKDPTGKAIKLSSLRGKYVLIDFWASWCEPCRKEMPNMVALNKKYKPKGLEIFGFSLDKNPQDWQQAIMHDGLTWKQASDLREWHSSYIAAYYIQGIPYTVLLDKSGKVIAKGLSAAELDEKLAEILK